MLNSWKWIVVDIYQFFDTQHLKSLATCVIFITVWALEERIKSQHSPSLAEEGHRHMTCLYQAYPLRAGTRLEVRRNRSHKDTLWQQLSTLRLWEGAWQSARICSVGEASCSVCAQWCLPRPSSDAWVLGWAVAWLFGPSGYSVSHPKILIHYFSLYISLSWSPWLLKSSITFSLEFLLSV